MWRWTGQMIVFGTDAHKRLHTVAAVTAATGELLGEQTVQVGAKGATVLLRWARGLGAERVWALGGLSACLGFAGAVSD
jgi:hypothetical protein